VTLEYLKKLDIEYSKLVRNVPCRVIVVNADRPVEEIHKEICQHIEENELFFSNSNWEKMHKEGGSRWKMQLAYFANMCNLFRRDQAK
jgi:hypothetical protein